MRPPPNTKRMKYYLFFDTETNGIPKNYKAPPSDLANWPRVIQLAWMICDESGEEIKSRCQLIKPDGWVIPKEKFWIENGYSTEKSESEGVGMVGELRKLASDIDRADMMVAHNLDFDTPIVSAEMIRYGVKASSRPNKFCTMKASTNICKIKGPYGYKWPKLEELHEYLFGCKFDGAHDALEDVRATARCFFELKKRELIKF